MRYSFTYYKSNCVFCIPGFPHTCIQSDAIVMGVGIVSWGAVIHPSLSRRFLNTKSDLRYIFIQVKRVIRGRACRLISNTVCWFHIVKSKFHCAFCCFASVIPCVCYDIGVDFISVSYYSSWGDSEFKRKSKNKRVHFTINIIKHCHKQGKLTVCLHIMNPIWLIFITEIYRS
jgi:hypothetical protein